MIYFALVSRGFAHVKVMPKMTANLSIESETNQGSLTCLSPKPILVYGIADTGYTCEK